MKILKHYLALVLFLMPLNLGNLYAQDKEENLTTKISYKVDFGPVYPIEGESYQLTGKTNLNDTTGEPESIDFRVLLNSFMGLNEGYLAWIGNSWYYPDLVFKSSKVTKKGTNQYIVNGQLQFRNMTSPVEINFTRRDTQNEIVLEGDFRMSTSDFFIIPPSKRLVPTFIPFELTLVFDKPQKEEVSQKSFH